jgi:hypothetical protein
MIVWERKTQCWRKENINVQHIQDKNKEWISELELYKNLPKCSKKTRRIMKYIYTQNLKSMDIEKECFTNGNLYLPQLIK